MNILKTADLDWEKMSLIPVITQEADTKEVLMLAYVNKAALELSISTGYAHYYSRSRNNLWKKGETSGHLQEIVEIKADCDNDAILYLVKQAGPACHTGAKSCFFKNIQQS